MALISVLRHSQIDQGALVDEHILMYGAITQAVFIGERLDPALLTPGTLPDQGEQQSARVRLHA